MNLMTKYFATVLLLAAVLISVDCSNLVAAEQPVKVRYKTAKVDDLDLFYREAGPKDCAGDFVATRFPDELANVSQFDSVARGQVPRDRPGLSRLRPELNATAR